MSAFTTDPFHTSNCRCCEAHARTLTDLAALVELGKERDYAMEMVNVQDNKIDALLSALQIARETIYSLDAREIYADELALVDAALAEGRS